MSVDPDHDQLGLFAVPATDLAVGTATPSPGVVTDPMLMPDTRAERHFWQHVVLTPRGCWYWIGTSGFIFGRHRGLAFSVQH